MIPAPPSKGRDEYNTTIEKQGNGVPYFSNRFFNLLDVENIRTVLKTQTPQSKEVGVCSFSPNLTLNLTEGKEYFIFDKNTYIKVIKENDSLNVTPYFVEKPFYYSYDNKNQMRVSDKKYVSADTSIPLSEKISNEERILEEQIKSQKTLKSEIINQLSLGKRKIEGLKKIINIIESDEEDVTFTKKEQNDIVNYTFNYDKSIVNLSDGIIDIKALIKILKEDSGVKTFMQNNQELSSLDPTGNEVVYATFLALSLLAVMKTTKKNFNKGKLMTKKEYEEKRKKEIGLGEPPIKSPPNNKAELIVDGIERRKEQVIEERIRKYEEKYNKNKKQYDEKSKKLQAKMEKFNKFFKFYNNMIIIPDRFNQIDAMKSLITNQEQKLELLELKLLRTETSRDDSRNQIRVGRTEKDSKIVSSRTEIKIVNKDLTDRDKEFLSVLNLPLKSLLPSNVKQVQSNTEIVNISPTELENLKIPKGTSKSKQLFDKGKTKSYLLEVLSYKKPHPSVTYEDESNGITSKVGWLIDCLGSLDSVVELRNDILLESRLDDSTGEWFQQEKQIKTVK